MFVTTRRVSKATPAVAGFAKNSDRNQLEHLNPGDTINVGQVITWHPTD
ncbi:DUF1589 domain-containing protein, partial [Rhodopirellula europaea]